MYDNLRENELEFFIVTNGALSAERSLLLTETLLRFVRSADGVGADGFVEIVHLGRGSFRIRLMILLRDPATQTIIAMAALALAGCQLLKDGNGDLAQEVAFACIESHATSCGFRTRDEEFLVQRDEMPAFKLVQTRQERTGEPIHPPPAGYEYITSEGKYLKEGDEFLIDRILPHASSDSIIKPSSDDDDSDQMEIDEIVTIYEDEEERIVWMDTGRSTIEVLNSDILPDFDGRGSYHIQGTMSPDRESITIKGAEKIEEKTSLQAALSEPSLVPWYATVGQKSTKYVGQLRGSLGNYTFKPENLSEAIVDEILGNLDVPTHQNIEIDAFLRRGSRGGMADPRLIITNWSYPSESHSAT